MLRRVQWHPAGMKIRLAHTIDVRPMGNTRVQSCVNLLETDETDGFADGLERLTTELTRLYWP